MWNEATVCMPHACPFARSASVHVIGFQSGASSRRTSVINSRICGVNAALPSVARLMMLSRSQFKRASGSVLTIWRTGRP